MKKAIIYFSVSFLVISCDYYDDRLTIVNDTAENVYVHISEDTILNLGENKTYMLEDSYIEAGSTKKIIEPGSQIAWENLASRNSNKQFHIFVLNEEKIKNMDQSQIDSKDAIEQIDISLKSLKEGKWKVPLTLNGS